MERLKESNKSCRSAKGTRLQRCPCKELVGLSSQNHHEWVWESGRRRKSFESRVKEEEDGERLGKRKQQQQEGSPAMSVPDPGSSKKGRCSKEEGSTGKALTAGGAVGAWREKKCSGGTEKQVEVRGQCSWVERVVHQEDRDSTQSCQRKG